MKTIAFILAGVVAPCFVIAQVPKTTVAPKQGKDRLLWYQGTRKNDSVLLANNGWQVTYSKSKNILQVKTTAKPRNFQRIERELLKSKLRKKEAINKITGGGAITASDLPAIRLALQEIDDVEKQYAGILKTDIILPEDESPSSTLSSRIHKGKGSAWDETGEYVEEFDWQQLFSTIQNDMKSLKNVDDLHLSAPPEYDVSICMVCDSTKKNELREKQNDYLKDLVKEEQAIIINIFRLYKYFDSHDGITTTDPQIAGVYNELRKDMERLQARVSKKLVKLVTVYKHDFLKLTSLMPLILGMDRQNQLLGIGELPPELDIANLIRNEDLNAYIDKLIAAEDYSRLLNFNWILGTDRILQMLSDHGIDESIMPKVLQFNRFALTVSYDVKEVDNDGQHSLKGMVRSETTYYRAIPTHHCKFFFIQSNGIKAMGVGEPFINFDLLQAEQTKCSYTGPKNWVAIDPYIKIGFCSDEDSVSLFPLIPNLQQPQETWVCEETEEHLSNLFASAFENNNNMADEEEFLEELQTIQKFTAGLSTPGEVVDHMIELNNGYAIVATIKEKYAQHAQTLVPVITNNGTTVLFNKLHNAKLYTTDREIVYANLWIKLEHVRER